MNKKLIKQITKEWNDDEDYIWSEKTAQFKDENELRGFLDKYFMKNIQIDFNFKKYKYILIDTNRKVIIPLLNESNANDFIITFEERNDEEVQVISDGIMNKLNK